MGALDLIYLFVVGLLGGIITSLVGGASVVTFPALVAFGLAPIDAAIVSLVALTPANLSAALWDRSQLPAFSSALWLLLAVCIAGSALGAWLLLVTPANLFSALVPLLLGVATLLFAYAGEIALSIERNAKSAAAAERTRWNMAIGAMVPVSIYGGYFGAGAGVMLLAILMVISRGDYRAGNALKNLVAGVNCTVATAVYVVQDKVEWGPVAMLTGGAMIGAVIGIRIVRIAPREVMRRGVIGLGALLSVVLAWKYWF